MRLRNWKRRLPGWAVAALGTALGLLAQSILPASAAASNAVEHQGTLYVQLDALLAPEFLDGQSELTNWGRDIVTTTPRAQVTIFEGGDRFHTDGRTTIPLEHPVLVLEGRHYLPVQEFAGAFGYAYDPGPPPQLTCGPRKLRLEPETVDSPFRSVEVKELHPVHRPLRLVSEIPALRNLHRDGDQGAREILKPGTRLLARRSVFLNGVPHMLVTRNDAQLETFAVETEALEAASRDDTLSGTVLARIRERLSDLATTQTSVNFGPRSELTRTIAVTIDLCWSLRAFEQEFFECIPLMAREAGELWVTLFFSGRWVQQHPEEMHKLLELARKPGVRVIWALHSWDHPKEGMFMNAYSPEQIRADTMRLEAILLEWGIVPSLFYRYPGLIHDETRLRTLLELDLISVDCDSWVNGMRAGKPPHRMPARDGSILLIHGNGNEAAGIPKLYDWLLRHPGWRWGPLHRFVLRANEEEGPEIPPAGGTSGARTDP